MQWKFRGHRSEIIVYFAVYIVYLIYGLWVVIGARERIIEVSILEFPVGWSIWDTQRDDTNDELENFTEYVYDNWHWYIVHFLLSSLAVKWWPQWQTFTHVLLCCIVLKASMHFISLCIFGMLLLSYYVAVNCRKVTKKHIWMLAAIWMAITHTIKGSEYFYSLSYTEYFTLIQLLSWTVLRNSSYALQSRYPTTKRTGECKPFDYSLMNFLGYTLYFPCLIYGPYMSYARYTGRATIISQNIDYGGRFGDLLWRLLRVLFWWFFLMTATHYMYLYYMARDVNAVRVVNTTFGLHAIGYFMGQYFYLFYVITYGLGIAFARYDGLQPPKGPRCIGRIHFYSDMWKYFDEGLYEFLFDHIYAELCSKNSRIIRKLSASLITFTFVFIWHGCHSFVLIWSTLNFICLVVEKLFKYLISSPSYARFVTEVLGFGKGGMQRLTAVLATQIFIPAAFSNVFFISGVEVGLYLIRGAYTTGWWNYILLTFCSYCFIQCSHYQL